MSGQVFGSEGLAINIAVYEKNVPVNFYALLQLDSQQCFTEI